MRCLIAIIAVSCLAQAAGCNGRSRDNSTAPINAARRLLNEQRQEQRAEMERLDKLIRKNPDDPALYVQRGFLWIEREDYFSAEDQFDLALRIERQHPGALCGAAVVTFYTKNDLELLEHLATTRTPQYAPVHYWLGRARQSAGEYDAAIEAYGKAIELNPTYAEAYRARGSTAIEQSAELQQESDDAAGALADFRQAIFFDPQMAAAYTNSGDVLMDQDEVERALRSYARAISIEPADPYAYSRRGRALAAMEKYRDAARDYALAQELAERTDRWEVIAAMNFDRGVALFHVGDHYEAMRVLSSEIESDPLNADARCYHADCLMEVWGRAWEAKGEYSEAIRLYEQAKRDDDPEYDESMHARALYGRARAHEEAGSSRAAKRDRSEANRVDSDYADEDR